MKKLTIFTILLAALLALGCVSLLGHSGATSKMSAAPPPPPAPASRPGEYHGNYYEGEGESLPSAASPPQTVVRKKRTRAPVEPGLTLMQVETSKAEHADAVLEQLTLAGIAFVIPESANIEDAISAQLLIDINKTEAELADALTVEGQQFTGKVAISKIVVAELHAPDFEVTQITPAQQAISETQPTEWLWTLTPKSVGTHSIYLTINAVVSVDDIKVERSIKTFAKTVKIEITRKQVVYAWISDNWEWAWSTLLVPLAAWLWSRRKKQRK